MRPNNPGLRRNVYTTDRCARRHRNRCCCFRIESTWIIDRQIHLLHKLAALQGRPNTSVVAVCGRLEAELGEMEEKEAAELLASYGLREPGLNRLIRATYDLMGLISFFTAGEPEVRAWTIRKESNAVKAAGAIHSDIEKGFIRAETIAFNDYVAGNGETGAKEAGKMRLEGKEYIVQDGDVMHFRFAN